MAWKFIEGLTVADVAFEAKGNTLEELFESCAQATTATMVKEVSSVKQLKTRKFALLEDSEEKLLFEFLQKLVYYKDADVLLFSKYAVKITQNKKNNLFKLDAVVKGDKINPKTHEHFNPEQVLFIASSRERTPQGYYAGFYRLVKKVAPRLGKTLFVHEYNPMLGRCKLGKRPGANSDAGLHVELGSLLQNYLKEHEKATGAIPSFSDFLYKNMNITKHAPEKLLQLLGQIKAGKWTPKDEHDLVYFLQMEYSPHPSLRS